MEMERRTIQRGILALAIVTSLSAAGSRPAAAADLRLLDRFDRLWSFVTGGTSHAPHPATNRSHGVPQKATTPPPQPTDRGFGIDPNGLTTGPGTLPIGG